MVFCYQNCSDLLWEKIVLVIEKFEDEGWEFDKKFEITRTIYSNSERLEQFLVTFLTCSWWFLIYNKLEWLELKLQKNIGI